MKKIHLFVFTIFVGCLQICLADEPALAYDMPLNAEVAFMPRSMSRADDEYRFKDVTVEQAGTLASLLGEEINDIDSLVVRGLVNEEDINTMWSSTFYGRVEVLNLEYAEIQGNKLPKAAFWHTDEQMTPDHAYFYSIKLRKIILPESLEEIGEAAFLWAMKFQDINFPSSLKSIGPYCFSYCRKLNVNPIVFPEGLEEIGSMAFHDCPSLKSKVVLPSTLKRIKMGAFFQAYITECVFSDGLEEIGDYAFYASKFKEVVFPGTCTKIGEGAFALNYNFETIYLSGGIRYLPKDFCQDCMELRVVGLPATVDAINGSAFDGCHKIERIYCAAIEPPVCEENGPTSGRFAFSSAPATTVVYVPIGTSEKYRNAWGWNSFTNYIETDDFPFAGVAEVSVDKAGEDAAFYDLQGRKVAQPVEGRLYIRNGKVMLYQ